MTKRILAAAAAIAILAGSSAAWGQSNDDQMKADQLAQDVGKAVAALLLTNPNATATDIQATINSVVTVSGATPAQAVAAIQAVANVSVSAAVKSAAITVQSIVIAAVPAAQKAAVQAQAGNMVVAAQTFATTGASLASSSNSNSGGGSNPGAGAKLADNQGATVGSPPSSPPGLTGVNGNGTPGGPSGFGNGTPGGPSGFGNSGSSNGAAVYHTP